MELGPARDTAEVKDRVKELLYDVFKNSDKYVVSLTAHSLLIHGSHAVTNHPDI
jgi:hypothetical protein